jgi:hypothetical protein
MHISYDASHCPTFWLSFFECLFRKEQWHGERGSFELI